ncbi:hypothetical protein SI65_07005 [Aspergillus cristatus]|uniref:DBF4-type domain-containing protein n=1 Tax=Aspergillus cristatus TaxID=573508 RepID=A0A1E3B8M9_ASPCR|nr:hypothetical protein SI65_07005 [Aspergillus cristatus]
MSTRRPPLANVPNATNSPLRMGGTVPAKRSRTASTQLEIPYGQPPPKKQVIDGVEQDVRSPSRARSTAHQQPGDSRIFSRRSNNAQPSAFERKLYAAREKDRQTATKPVRNEKPSAETLDTIRQWQRHYRKAFPTFVFYFDSIPEDVRGRCSRQVNALGAREEKFFSRLVTHVVTSRPIPPEHAVNPPETSRASVDHTSGGDGSLQTVNPSLLERNPEMHVHTSLKNDARREQMNMDVLHRARQMGMKIWALEKLQRMIATINDPDISGHDPSNRNNGPGGGHTRGRENDLSQVLRNELVNGPSDRDHLSSLKELVMFKGPFIYVHDMNEKTRPVMVREYPKAARRQDGIWPQFRSAPLGKCPFIDEPPTKKEMDRQRIRQQAKEKKVAPKPAPVQENRDQEFAVREDTISQEPADGVASNEHKPRNEQEAAPPHQPEMRDMVPPRPGSPPRKSSESFNPPQMPRNGPFFLGREPAASGMQPSNITSAIRSQMVSSTAAAPGAKAGLSKEVHELKRKVLEKGNGLSGAHGAADAASWKINQSQRPGKANPQEKPDTTQPEAVKKQSRDRKDSIQKKERPRDPKPGYCENCRDKFDDFEKHTQTRKHRRFALTTSNWVELDDLLFELDRPLKEEYMHEHI